LQSRNGNQSLVPAREGEDSKACTGQDALGAFDEIVRRHNAFGSGLASRDHQQREQQQWSCLQHGLRTR